MGEGEKGSSTKEVTRGRDSLEAVVSGLASRGAQIEGPMPVHRGGLRGTAMMLRTGRIDRGTHEALSERAETRLRVVAREYEKE
jgi:hypothetical protein